MPITDYHFDKLCDSGRLTKEIQESDIIIALDHIETVSDPEETIVFFKDTLSSGDEETLSGIVSGHTNTPLPENQLTSVVLKNPDGRDVPCDSDGSTIIKTKTTRTGWHYEPRSIDFFTSKDNSEYNRKHNTGLIDTGTSYGDAVLRFFDAGMNELVSGVGETAEEYQTRLDENCTVTYLDWQPTYEMDIIGGMLQVLEPPPDRAYMWAIVAPDIPEVYGGSVPFLAGGFNLQYSKSGDLFLFNGRGVKSFAPDFVYNSNKFRIVVKHSVGRQIGIQVYFEHFKA